MSSLATPQRTSAAPRTKASHLAPKGAMSAARDMGVQYRTNCGLWLFPAPRIVLRRQVSELPPNTCKNCIRVAVARGR